jgi:hypothetical protein
MATHPEFSGIEQPCLRLATNMISSSVGKYQNLAGLIELFFFAVEA